MPFIDTERYSRHLRERAIQREEKKILISCLQGSDQEKDFTSPVNCNGYGRIRHFSVYKHLDWSTNPLPVFPAAKALGLPFDTTLHAQVFQNAACNWRCWYCFVDFALLSANQRLAQFFTPTELIDLHLKEENYPKVLDLSGGQPDLVPEWILWTMEALDDRGLAGKLFLWSDDNLSNDYFWKFLTRKQRRYVAGFPHYARVGCFKGYDAVSFAFNTRASFELFNQQFKIFQGLLKEGIDMYAYVTFTALPHTGLSHAMEEFVDRLQKIHSSLPLRTVPLKIEVFTPTRKRVGKEQEQAIFFQHEVHHAWREELQKRFSKEERDIPISDVSMNIDE